MANTIKKKTIWIVNQYNFPDLSNTRQTNLCSLLNERGYDAYIISGSSVFDSSAYKNKKNRVTKKEKLKFVKTKEAKGFIIHSPDYYSQVQRIFSTIIFEHNLWKYKKKLPEPDVIVSDFAGLFGNIVLKWKHRYGTKIIFDILDLWPEDFVNMGYLKKNSLITKILYNMEHKSYREADGIIFSFEGGKDYICDKGWSRDKGGDVDISHIGYLNNGVNLEIVDSQRNKFVLDDVDLDSSKFKAIYLGSVSEFNGLDVLVEAARVLDQKHAGNILILVYGYGNQEARLKEKVHEYGLNNIKFKGKLDYKFASNVLSRGDLNLFTFKDSPILKYGTSPNKLFMYFASGKPVLSMITPKYDLVEKENAGISVQNDPEVIADALIKFSKMNPKQYQIYCNNARRLGSEYDYKKLVNVLIEQIERN
jgi:glycosyltransferase involved in cell wall biosynthesis